MKKRILIAIFVVTFILSLFVPAALADQIGTLNYSVSTTRVDMTSAGTGSFTITIPRPTGTYTEFCGAQYTIQLPSGATFGAITYNLAGGTAFPPEVPPSLAGTGTYLFSYYHASSNVFNNDLICTVNINYAGATDAVVTIRQVGQAMYKTTGGGTDTLVSSPSNQPTVTLAPYSAVPAVTGVTVSPASAGVAKGSTKQFTEIVNALNGAAATVTWSVTGNASTGTTISASGLLTVAAGETASVLTVRATSTFDTTKSGTASVNVLAAGGPLSSDATLSALSVSGYTLSPAFSAAQTSYTVTVPNSVTGVTVNATKNDVGATVEITGNTSLAVGDNTVTVKVTAEDGTTVKLYTIKVVREGSGGDGGGDNGGNGGSGSGGSGGGGATTSPPAFPFTDVDEGDWFYDDVYYMWEKSLMEGTSQTLFSPYRVLTRGTVVTVLYRMENSSSVAGLDNPFPDVAANQWYTDAIIWAADKKIVLGYGSGKFGPDDYITREQMSAILFRYENATKKIPPSKLAENSFADAASISDYAKEAVGVLVMQGIINGKPNNRFDPKGNATRSEFAAVLHRFLTAR